MNDPNIHHSIRMEMPDLEGPPTAPTVMSPRPVGKPSARFARLLPNTVMIVCGLFGLNATPLGLAIAGVGVASFVTGLVSRCPACALAGRKPIEIR